QAVIAQKVTPMYEEGLEKLYQNIDYTRFRDDVDVNKAMEILTWTMFGFGEKGLKELQAFKDLEKFGEYYLQEWEQYAAILKQSFYKERYLLYGKKDWGYLALISPCSIDKRRDSEMKNIVEVQGLQKTFGNFEALKDVSFTVNPGEVLGFIGPNGAGKSTTIRILLGIIKRNAGKAEIFGK